MSKALRALREWYIVAIALILFGGGFFFASHQNAPSTPATAQDGPSRSPEIADRASPAAKPAMNAASTTPSAPGEQPHSSTMATATANPPPPPAEVTPPAHAHSMAHEMTTVAAGTSAPAQPAAQATPMAGGDPVAGRLVFRKCQACHSMEPGKIILGPSLAGIIGRKAGSKSSYNYSPAMKQANIVWDAKTLDAYLRDPQKLVPGNRMPFPGLKTDDDRADVIAFFATSAAQPAEVAPGAAPPAAVAQPAPAAKNPAPAAANQAPQLVPSPDIGYLLDAKYTLRSGIAEGRMVYVGVGGAIDGKVNPVLTAAEGQVVELTLINGEGAEHDYCLPRPKRQIPARDREGCEHHDCLPRGENRRLHLFLQRTGTSAGGYAGPIHRYRKAGSADACRG